MASSPENCWNPSYVPPDSANLATASVSCEFFLLGGLSISFTNADARTCCPNMTHILISPKHALNSAADCFEVSNTVLCSVVSPVGRGLRILNCLVYSTSLPNTIFNTSDTNILLRQRCCIPVTALNILSGKPFTGKPKTVASVLL